MRIFQNELYKLFLSKAFLLVTAAAILLNVYIASTKSFGNFSDAEYKAYLENVSGMTAEEALEYDEELYQTIRQTGEPVYCEYYWQDMYILSGEISRLEEILGYQDYLAEINTTAETMTSVSIFADTDSFSYRNIVKTPSAYEAVHDVTPTYAPSDGVLLATDNVSTDILVMFSLLACVTAVFYKDRESGVVTLIKPLKYGRARLALAKSAVVFTVCFATFGIMYLSNLAIGAYRCGLGDLSRAVQSLEGYLGCNLAITVSELLVFDFVVKLFALTLCALIISALFIRLSNIIAYVVTIATAAVETALYALISGNSIFSPLKYINLVAFTQPGNFLKTYTNINFFGYPVKLSACTAICLLLGLIAVTIIVCRLYSSISISEIRRSSASALSKYVPKSLFSYTAYKALVMHKGAVIIAAVLAIQLYTAFNYSKPYNPDDNYYLYYCTQISEMTDDEAVEFIAIEPANFDSDYAEKGFEKAKSQYEYLVSIGKGTADMFYETGYRLIFGLDTLRQDYILGLIAVAALCLMLSPVVAYDNRCRIGYVLYTTKAGRKTYYRHNSIMAIILAVVVSLSVNLPYFTQILSAYGLGGITSGVNCISDMLALGELPVWGYLVILLAYRTAVLILFSLLLLWISSKCQSPTTALVVTLAIFCLPIIIYLAGMDSARFLSLPVSGNREIQAIAKIIP
ncbi:MAG: hypothetical protein LUG49_00895 [Oscillospiraceae bacterium]|nr:hypothetical protein [Oscillospiraceae bacterium]